MLSLNAIPLSLLILFALLLLVAPFLDLPISIRLKKSPADDQLRLKLYRNILLYLWILAAYAFFFRSGTTLSVPHLPGDAPWLFAARWRTWTITALLSVYFFATLSPGFFSLLTPHRIAIYTRVYARYAWMLPHNVQQRRWFVALSFTAGICEEWLFRGVFSHALHAKLGLSLTATLLIASIGFGWNHIYQGWKGALGTTLAGLAFGLAALLSGTLIVPIVLHCLVDLQIALAFRPDKFPTTKGGTVAPPVSQPDTLPSV